MDGITWLQSKSSKEYRANTDETSIVTNFMSDSFTARAVRIIPTLWKNHISMRAEVYIIDDK